MLLLFSAKRMVGSVQLTHRSRYPVAIDRLVNERCSPQSRAPGSVVVHKEVTGMDGSEFHGRILRASEAGTRPDRGCNSNLTGGPSRRNRVRIKAFVAAILALFGVTMLIGVQPATADTVRAYGDGGMVITVNTGQKNYGNHTQYVASIYVLDVAGWICDRTDPTEAWAGNVWYTRETGCSRGSLYTIGRWVPSGSGVCGSYWRWKSFPGTFPWSPPRIMKFRFVTCITIRV